MNLVNPTDKQVRIAEGMTTAALEKSRHDNEARLHGMTYEEWEGEEGKVAIAWRAAIDRVLGRRKLQDDLDKHGEFFPRRGGVTRI